MSSQLKEKQQQKDNKHELEADKVFNQHLFNTLAYAGAGFGAGLVASVFFKHRKALTLLGAGSGAAYGASNFMNELNQFNRFKDYANQSQQSNTLKREDQLSTKNWEDFMPKQESLGQQKRYGGSGDDDDKGSKSKTHDNKSNEKKGHGPTATDPKTQGKSPDQSLHTSPTGAKESPNLNPKNSHDKTLDKSSWAFGRDKDENNAHFSSGNKSAHDKVLDKSSYDFGKGKDESSKSSSDNKGSQQSGDHKSNAPKSSSTSPKEINKSHQDQQKGDSHKNLGHSKDQQRSKESEKSGSTKFESKSDDKGQGQNFQNFQSNPGAGKPAPEESKIHRGAERDVHNNRDLENSRGHQNRIEQDRWGLTAHTGLKNYEGFPSDSKAGSQFNEQGLTAKDQVNAVIE